MSVTPYITAGNDVRLVVEQEVSSPDYSKVTSSYMPPNISKKEMETELLVPDNSTLLLGGMIQTTRGDSNGGIPFLKDIPILGHLFRTNSYDYVRSELLVLITVNVIDTRNPQEELIRRYKASLEEIEKTRSTELY